MRTDNRTLEALVRNLGGLSTGDARRLARKVIFDDGAITESDLSAVMSAKYELLNQDGLLSFEYDTEKFSDVGGMSKLKRWLENRDCLGGSFDEMAADDWTRHRRPMAQFGLVNTTGR